jgi:hypothetical protein
MLALPVRADHLSDLREWQKSGLIVVSNWNVDQFATDWHIEQVQRGNRLLPTTKLDTLNKNSSWYLGRGIKPANVEFMRANKLPLSLRAMNWATILTTRPRLPLVPESIPLSPVVWTRDANGVLHDPLILIGGAIVTWLIQKALDWILAWWRGTPTASENVTAMCAGLPGAGWQDDGEDD